MRKRIMAALLVLSMLGLAVPAQAETWAINYDHTQCGGGYNVTVKPSHSADSWLGYDGYRRRHSSVLVDVGPIFGGSYDCKIKHYFQRFYPTDGDWRTVGTWTQTIY